MTAHLATDEAEQAAEAAARSAGITVRVLHDPDEFAAAERLFRSIWGPDQPTVPAELMRAFAHAGNYVAGAYADRELVGVCAGFYAEPGSGSMHSHAAGVSAAVRGRSVGFALKLHQRAWALRRAITTILWTFDPLVRRNAYFNLTKLGARATEYLVNFYGTMQDAINAGERSDRLMVSWPLRDADVVRACAGHLNEPALDELYGRGAAIVLDEDSSGYPATGDAGRALSLVRVPADIEALRRSDQRAARAWREAVADTLGVLLASGAAVSGFTRNGYYVVERR